MPRLRYSSSSGHNNYVAEYDNIEELVKDRLSMAPGILQITELTKVDKGICLIFDYRTLNLKYSFRFVDLDNDEHRLEVMSTADNQKRLEYLEYHTGDGYDAAWGFLTKVYATFRGETKRFQIIVDTWPAVITTIPQIRKIPEWYVSLDDHIYPEFLDTMGDSDNVTTARFVGKDGRCFVMPQNFFDTEFAKNLKSLTIDVHNEMNDEILMKTKTQKMIIKQSSISEIGINEKISQWYQGDSILAMMVLHTKYQIDEDVVKCGLRCEEDENRQITIQRKDGKLAELSFSNQFVRFKVVN